MSEFSKRKLAIPAAIALHVGATIVISIVGRFVPLFQVFPDSERYQTQIVLVTDVLRNRGFEAWFFSLLPFHVKLYSLCFALFAPWLGFSILLIEPLNAVYYTAILCCVYYLARRAFGQQTAILATVIVGLWPSFVAHTTQPLKDPLFLLLALLFLTINCFWLMKDYSWAKAMMIAILGVITECLLWIVKADMWELMIAIGFLTCGILVFKMFRERKATWGNLAGALSLVIISLVIPRVALQFYGPALGWSQSRGVAALYTEPKPAPVVVPLQNYPLARISQQREKFIVSYPHAGSNIDTDVSFNGTTDVICYLPRAALIGLFAPFPKMWFATGSQNGRLGRIIGGLETLGLYLIQLMALSGLWHKRRLLAAWWLFIVAILGATALGLVVTNVGALHRMRYLFVFLFVILGSEGVRQTLRCIADARRRTAVKQLLQV